MAQLIVYNPLPQAYSHRERQLIATFGEDIEFVRTENEGLARMARLRALARHVRVVRRLRRSSVPVLVTWPLLGWLEIVLWASSARSVHLSIHDPRPLRRQFGLGRVAAWLARRVPRRSRPAIIAHSSVAAEIIRATLPGSEISQLPLPMLPRTDRPSGARSRRVLVLGQYKPARDLEILVRLGTLLPGLGLDGVIAGRGWPAVAGWTVYDRFLTEDEFDSELESAGCLLLPYRHYFQSGVAARAAELGTPVVAAEHPFLMESLGLDGAPGIVRDADSLDAWSSAVVAAIESDVAHSDLFEKTRARWWEWYSRTGGANRNEQRF